MKFANEGYYAYDQNGNVCYVVGNGAQFNYPSYWYGNNSTWNYPFYGNHCGTCGVDNRAWNNGWR